MVLAWIRGSRTKQSGRSSADTFKGSQFPWGKAERTLQRRLRVFATEQAQRGVRDAAAGDCGALWELQHLVEMTTREA